MLAPLAALLLVALPIQDAETKPTDARETTETTTSPPESPAPDVELSEELRAMLEEVERLRDAGELDAARELLGELVRGEVFRGLLKQGHEVVLVGLAALDAAAETLHATDVQIVVREHVVERQSESLDPEHEDLLAARFLLAAKLAQFGDLEGALEHFEPLHAAWERMLPGDHPTLLHAKHNLATVRSQLGDLEGALELAEQVHAVRARLLPQDDPYLLAAKQLLASLRHQLGDLESARELMEHLHATRERLLPEDHPHLLDSKEGLAVVRDQLGDLEGAHALLEHVHAVRARLLPEDHRDLLRTKLNLASSRSDLGDIDGALTLQEQVHASRVRALPADHPDLLLVKQHLAVTYSQLGDLREAHALLEHVHAAQARLLPEEHPHLLSTKGSLATTCQRIGDLERARYLKEHVHAVRSQLLPDNHPDLLAAMESLAVARMQIGDLVGASSLAEQVHAARSHLLPEDHPDLILANQNLSATRFLMGDLDGAHKLAEQVHDVREQQLPEDHPDLLVAKGNLAATLKLLGDLEGAHALEAHVHAVWSELLPVDHPDLQAAKLNLAGTRRLRGDFGGALALEEHVHTARVRLLPVNHPDLLAAKLRLATSRRQSGDLEGALAMIRSFLSSQLARATSLLIESPRVARAAAVGELNRLSRALFLAEMGVGDEDSLLVPLFTILATLRVASTGSSEVALALSSTPTLDPIRDRLARSRKELSDLSMSSPENASEVALWRERLLDLSHERDRLERELRSELGALEIRTRPPAVEVVARALDARSALVSFFRYKRFLDAESAKVDTPRYLDSVLAFLVTSDATVRRIELGPSAELEALATTWRALIGKPVERGIGVGEPVSTQTEEMVGRELAKKLLGPCLGALDERPAQLHLVLDDFLHLVPVDALPWDGDKRVGEALTVRLETSTRRLIAPPHRARHGSSLLALGGVDFDATGVGMPTEVIFVATPPTSGLVDRKGAPSNFGPLIQSRIETETLGVLFEDLVGGNSVILTKDKASKAALHEFAPKARYLHIATHGWFAPETFKSMIDSAEEQSERDLYMRAEDTIVGFAPETLCGLALAGANHGANELGKVPGIMTAEELATLDLSNCELAVLSACETNVGIRRAGQGIQSLQAALHAAGARTAITSLWRVDDAATRRLMELFYTKLWKDKLGKADALWQAKMALRAEGHPIRDWAGWVLTGDPD